MIPVGYLRKLKTARPTWIDAPQVESVIAVSDCLMKPVLDVFTLGGFNGWFFFDAPACFDPTLRGLGANFEETLLLYFEVYEEAYDEQARTWSPVPLPKEAVNVSPPVHARLLGFDVTSFSMSSTPECSGLSCNGIASEVEVNAYGLFATVEEAKAALVNGFFDGSEPGPFRIFAVHEVDGSISQLS